MARAPDSPPLRRSGAQSSQQRNRAAAHMPRTAPAVTVPGTCETAPRYGGARLRRQAHERPPQVVSGACARGVAGIVEFLG